MRLQVNLINRLAFVFTSRHILNVTLLMGVAVNQPKSQELAG